jgi:type IV pilus assembly protein PilC
MRQFRYRAKTPDGKTVTGIVEANSKKGAVRLLHDKKLIVFHLKENIRRKSFNIRLLNRVTQKDITEFTRQLATMIAAGLTLTNALEILQKQSSPALAKMLGDINKKIEGGSSFHEALSTHKEVFSNIYLALVKSGEAAGKLDKILKQLADNLEKQLAFNRKIKGALIYPVIVVIGMIGVVFVMMVYVIPKLTEMYQEMSLQLPAATQMLIAVSNIMANYWFLIIAAVVGLVFALKKWRETSLGRQKTDELLLKVPIVGNLISKITLTQITRVLSMLIGAGVPLIEALEIVAGASNNVVFEKSMLSASKAVEEGNSLTLALEQFKEYPPIVTQMVSVGEQTGKIDEVLAKVAIYFEQQAEDAVKNLTTAIEPVMIIILGIGVGFVVISVIKPIYNLTSQF